MIIMRTKQKHKINNLNDKEYDNYIKKLVGEEEMKVLIEPIEEIKD